MTLKQSEMNLSNLSCCKGKEAFLVQERTPSHGRDFRKRDTIASFIFPSKLLDSLRKYGSKEQNKTLTNMTE